MSLKHQFLRLQFNLYPVYRRTGAKITYISEDYLEVKVKIPFNQKTKNIFGTIYGGTIYSAIDPIYLMMLYRIFKKQYIFWDKSAFIEYKKPARSSLHAQFILQKEEIVNIKELLKSNFKINRTYNIELLDSSGDVCATCQKVVHIRHKGEEEAFIPETMEQS